MVFRGVGRARRDRLEAEADLQMQLDYRLASLIAVGVSNPSKFPKPEDVGAGKSKKTELSKKAKEQLLAAQVAGRLMAQKRVAKHGG